MEKKENKETMDVRDDGLGMERGYARQLYFLCSNTLGG